jgi:hypothetical protein
MITTIPIFKMQQKKITINLALHQIEAISSTNGLDLIK